MERIGIRELRQQASRYLREVQRGETIEVTNRGLPVAWLVPVGRHGGIAGLAANGRLAPAVGDALSLGAPLAPAAGVALPSNALAEARADER